MVKVNGKTNNRPLAPFQPLKESEEPFCKCCGNWFASLIHLFIHFVSEGIFNDIIGSFNWSIAFQEEPSSRILKENVYFQEHKQH